MTDSINTRDVAAKQKIILNNWFEHLKESGEWKKWINREGKLVVSDAKKELYFLETGERGGSWHNGCFKGSHWTQILRAGIDGNGGFEGWVREKLAMRPGRDLFGNALPDSLDLPVWLEDEGLSDDVMKLLEGFAKKQKKDSAEINRLQSIIDRRDQKILELETIEENTERTRELDDHHKDNVRTFRYGAGMDVDLSKEDLLGGAR